MHVNVHAPSGEAKFWLEPRIELAQTCGLSTRQVNTALRFERTRVGVGGMPVTVSLSMRRRARRSTRRYTS